MSRKLALIFRLFCAIATFTACVREPQLTEVVSDAAAQSRGTVDFIVSSDTKASCNGLDINFEAGDKISVNGIQYEVEDVKGVLMLRNVAVSADDVYSCVFPADGDFLGQNDSNFKWPNVQFYRKESFGREAMPLICYTKSPSSEGTFTLSFSPAMGVLVLPISASGVQIRSIKVEDNNFNPADGLTYMSGRMLPYDANGKVSNVLTADSKYFEISNAASTAECRNIVLLCNDAEGNGVTVSGKRNFYIVVPPRDYSSGLTVTITDNSHRSQTLSTSGSTKVGPGEKITMKTLNYSPDADLYFSENFDSMVYGSDPVGMRAGVVAYRGLLPNRSGSSQAGTFATSENTGLQSDWYYGIWADTKDSGSAAIKESSPGSDIYSNWHTNATNDNDDVYSCEDINTALIMSEPYIRCRGMWDWCPSRIMEFQGYILVGKSTSLGNVFKGLSSTGSPQGALKTPALTNIPTVENVRLGFKIAKGFCNEGQKIRIACQGAGYFLKFTCGDIPTEISEDGRYAYISKPSALSNSAWTEAEGIIAGATAETHFHFFSPDGSSKEKTTTFYLDDITVTKTDIKEEAKLRGSVTCDGTPVSGVAVTDGYSVTQTDTDGKYYIAPNTSAKFVYICTPSGYEAQRASGDILAKYFVSIDPSVFNNVNFELKAVNQSNYTLFVIADSHVIGGKSKYGASNDIYQYNTCFIPSAQDFIQKQSTPVYGIHLGDYTQCEYWSNYYSLANYYADTKILDIPFYHVIGNHDHDYNSGKYGDSHTAFEAVLGPRYYSFNIGKQHFVVLDDITVSTSSGSNLDFTISNEQISWLRQDITALSGDVSQIVVCTHCPVLNYDGTSYTIDSASGETLFEILKQYDVICLTGHNHYDRSSKGVRNGHNVIDFIHPSLAGTAWFTKLNVDGTLRSAGIYRVSGSTVKRSLYAFDSRSEKPYTIYNKDVDEYTGTQRLSLDDPTGEQQAILVNFPTAQTCTFSESTSGKGSVSSGTIYDLNYRNFYVNFNTSGKTLGSWQLPTSTGHIWRYIPANPDAEITIIAKDALGNVVSMEDSKYITTHIEH